MRGHRARSRDAIASARLDWLRRVGPDGMVGGSMTGTRHIHVSFAKTLLIQLVRSHGAASVAKNWTDTDDALIAAINADPREFFVSDDTCDRVGPDGSCLGHDVP
jgi:hypothetical protein